MAGIFDILANQGSGGGNALTDAQDKLASIDASLKRVSGREKSNVNPFVKVIEKAPGGEEIIDLEKVLPAGFMAGHIRNIGPEEVDVSFQAGPGTSQFSPPYPLPPMDEKLELGNFALRKLKITFPAENSDKGRVVVILQ